MNQTLLLVKSTELYFFSGINECEVQAVYQTDPETAADNKTVQPDQLTPFLGSWSQRLDQYDTIIFLDFGFEPWMAQYIRLKCNARLIFFIWNLIDDEKYEIIQTLQNTQWVDDIYTFSPEDALKYSLKHNSTYYKPIVSNRAQQPKYDIFFGGKNGGREEKILQIMQQYKEYGYRTKIHAPDFSAIPADNYLSYAEYCKMFLDSKAILEVLKEKQTGVTLRSMESIFFERKLITTNPHIKKYRFYDPNNIFVIESGNQEQIHEFMQLSYVPLPKDVISFYLPQNWLARFEWDQASVFQAELAIIRK